MLWPEWSEQERSAVPIARYFIFVGGTLAVLLFFADWYLPTPSPVFAVHQHDIDRTIIRIRSAHKWPEKVVLDTSHPTMTPPAAEEPPPVQSFRLASDEAGNQSNLEAMAQLKPDTQLAAVNHQTLQVKHGAQPKRRVTRRLARAKPVGSCCQFAQIDNRQTISNAMPRWDAVLSWPVAWPALTRRK
jgi:hypothetical protein